jgi:type IV pilus assembly protein PilC
MPTSQTYAYKARDAKGKVVKGRVDAPSEIAVTTRLRTMGLSPVTIAEASAGTGLQRDIKLPGLSKSVSLKDLAIMSRQMATMTSSGLTLLRTLNILTEQTENKQLGEILSSVTVFGNGQTPHCAPAHHDQPGSRG